MKAIKGLEHLMHGEAKRTGCSTSRREGSEESNQLV